MEWIKNILSNAEEEDLDEIVERIKQEFPKHAVPKEQYNKKADKVEELETELESAKEQLEQTNDQLENLKEAAEGKDELKEQLESIQSEYNEYKEKEQERINRIKKTSALEKELLTSNVPEDAVDLLISDFDLDELVLNDDGKIVNIDDHKEKVKEKRPSLFGEEKVRGNEPTDGNDPEPKDNPFKPDSLNLTKQGELVRNDPEKARRLIKAAGKDPANYNL